jgi:hypothetical protein
MGDLSEEEEERKKSVRGVSVNEMNICSLINTNPNPKRAAVVGE